MSTGSLALIITALLGAQIVALLLSGYYRRWQQHRAQPETVRSLSAATPVITMPESDKGSTWSGFREFEVQHRLYEDAGEQICSFHLAPVDGQPLPPFEPGQYLTFRLPSGDPDKTEIITRCYSLSDRPRPDYYRVTIKRVPPPAGEDGLPPGRGSNYFHDRIAQGSRLQVKAPAGRFHLERKGDRPLVLIGGGIGITPMLSMLGHLLENGSERNIWLFYGVRNSREMIMSENLRRLAERHPNFHLHICFSQPLQQDLPGIHFQHPGRVDIALLRNTLPLAGYQFYLCGPQPMMQSLVPELEALGFNPADVHYEAFGPASLMGRRAPIENTPSGNTSAHQIHFSKSDRRVTWQPGGGSLLELAEAEGIEVESGCRAGGCGACQTRLESGEVRYEAPPDTEIEVGHCLLCTSRPGSDLVLQL